MKTINGIKTDRGYVFKYTVAGFQRQYISHVDSSMWLERLPLFKKGDLVSLQPGWKGAKNEVEPTNPADLKKFYTAPQHRWVTYDIPIQHKEDGQDILILGHFNANSKHANQIGVVLDSVKQGLIIVSENAKGFIIGPGGSTIKMLSRIAGKQIKVLTCAEALDSALKEN